MEIQKLSFDGEGMSRVYEAPAWMVGVKNWKPANDITGIDCLERHNQTDELFVLLRGRCVLAFAKETSAGLEFGAIEMEPMHVYNIPRSMWHNTVTQKDTKLILVEDSSTSMENSEIRPLDPAQVSQLRTLVKF